ncbi:uncharacterized protein LOC131438198 isoform X2 [Malaya genurostris]|nr:uncharacterized protein LOC131438198 isoform X2 [Malaya genurostris]
MKCNDPNDFTCATCSESNCNVDNWLKCFDCDSDTAGCVGEQRVDSRKKFCMKYDKNDECYSMVNGTKVTRGCRSDLADPVSMCNNTRYCESCEGDACNGLSRERLTDKSMCVQCTSLEANCENVTIEAKECPLRSELCYSRVEGQVLQRGCLSQLSKSDRAKCINVKDTTCMACEAHGCNTIMWLHCHQCKETTDVNCIDEQTDAAPFCSNYKEGNRCYARLEGPKTTRGCETDLEASHPCKENEKCRTCSTDGCNGHVAAALNSTERCLQCSTAGVGIRKRCLLGTAASQPCAKAATGKCYSRIDSNGALHRGCQSELSAEQTTACTGKTCAICAGKNCNNGTFPGDRLQCFQCSSSSDKMCSEQLTIAMNASYCQKYKIGDKCFSRLVNGIVERGCESDLAALACDGLKTNECQVCTENNCNSLFLKQLNSSSSAFSISLLLAGLSFVVLILTAPH